MRNWLLPTLCALIAGCATPPPPAVPAAVFDDALFAAPSEPVSADEIFAVSEAMEQYLRRPDIAAQLRSKGPQRGLLEALYERRELKLVYDASTTRTAAQAFDARSGNCLSLVVMTAAFARELGLQVSYRSALIEDLVTRSNNLLLRSGHVNVTLSRRFAEVFRPQHDAMTVDFLPPDELRGLRTREISEATVIAMFMNNRAVETMLDGRIDDAYAWARESIRTDPGFVSALNTLGVIYLRRGALTQATVVFGHVLERDAANRAALANLANTYARMGRVDESMALQRRLAALEPQPPLQEFHLGLAAMKQQDFRAAREHFAREAARGDGNHELHYWQALASLKLGDYDAARRQLKLALQASPTIKDRETYSAKLDWLAAHAKR